MYSGTNITPEDEDDVEDFFNAAEFGASGKPCQPSYPKCSKSFNSLFSQINFKKRKNQYFFSPQASKISYIWDRG